MSDNDRLSQIPTLWTVVRRAHADETVQARSAQQEMIDRYGGAIQRYLLGAFRDPTAADDAYQEFALRFLQGKYRSADPDRGRFRSFLKTILYRLVVEHHRGKKRRKTAQMASEFPEAAVMDESESDEQFQQSWRDELLKRAWDALKVVEEESGRPVFTVMRARVEGPELNSAELASRLTEQLGKNVTTANLRVMLHRARDEFAKLLFDEVADTMDEPSRASIEDELIELGLLEYCRPALERLDSERLGDKASD